MFPDKVSGEARQHGMPKNSKKRSVTIGLLGGIGSGKSFVTLIFRQMGARVIDADRIVRDLLSTAAAKRAYVKAWGPVVLGRGGGLDPAAVARRVFGRPQEVRRLNRLIHPFVIREIRRRLRAARGRPVVIDAPLLLETGTDRLCDVLVYVDAPLGRRLARVKARGWSAAELARREAAQWPLSKKKRRADHVVWNGGTAAGTRRRIKDVWKKIMAG